jgi:predicted RNase H-like nuclease (RuvC/YqgF family)
VGALKEETSTQQELLNAYRDLSNCQRSLLQHELTIKNMAEEIRQKDEEIERLKRQLGQVRLHSKEAVGRYSLSLLNVERL